MQEESKIFPPTEWGETLFFSLLFNKKEDQHATPDWYLPYDVFVSRLRRRSVRHPHAGLAGNIADRPGAPVRRVCRHQRPHCGGGCPARRGGIGVGAALLRRDPGDHGRRWRPWLVRDQSPSL